VSTATELFARGKTDQHMWNNCSTVGSESHCKLVRQKISSFSTASA